MISGGSSTTHVDPDRLCYLIWTLGQEPANTHKQHLWWRWWMGVREVGVNCVFIINVCVFVCVSGGLEVGGGGGGGGTQVESC